MNTTIYLESILFSVAYVLNFEIGYSLFDNGNDWRI